MLLDITRADDSRSRKKVISRPPVRGSDCTIENYKPEIEFENLISNIATQVKHREQ